MARHALTQLELEMATSRGGRVKGKRRRKRRKEIKLGIEQVSSTISGWFYDSDSLDLQKYLFNFDKFSIENITMQDVSCNFPSFIRMKGLQRVASI